MRIPEGSLFGQGVRVKLALGLEDKLNRIYYAYQLLAVNNYSVPETFEEYVKQGQLSNVMVTEIHEDYDSQGVKFDREERYRDEFKEMRDKHLIDFTKMRKVRRDFW